MRNPERKRHLVTAAPQTGPRIPAKLQGTSRVDLVKEPRACGKLTVRSSCWVKPMFSRYLAVLSRQFAPLGASGSPPINPLVKHAYQGRFLSSFSSCECRYQGKSRHLASLQVLCPPYCCKPLNLANNGIEASRWASNQRGYCYVSLAFFGFVFESSAILGPLSNPTVV